MADMVDQRLYEELAKQDPEEVITLPFCKYNEADGCYIVSAWGGEFAIYPHSARIEVASGQVEPHDYFYVFLINYLFLKKKSTPDGEWLSVKDLPGGVTFFRGPHEIPTRLITDFCDDDLTALKKRCEELGGVPLEMADCSYKFEIIGAMQVALLYWQGDEDFPAEATILVDKSIVDTPLDIVYALLCEVCHRLGHSKTE